MPRTIPLARYLFTRLAQQNVHAVHGVPGDFTLKALDHTGPAGLKWIGNCNELNAGYAADGYARVRGLGALFTTYGVGELSAINAVAGSYAEHVPVVHIVGSPAKRSLDDARRRSRVPVHVHHTLGLGQRPDVFRRMAPSVTVAQAYLDDGKTAADEVDRVLRACVRESRPVYLDLPSNMVPVEVDAEQLEEPLVSESEVMDRATIDSQVSMLLEKIYGARQPLLLVDRADGVSSMKTEINDFVRRSGLPTLAMPSGAGMVESSISNFYGVHSGPVGQVDTLPYLNDSDLVLAFGPLFSDTQTLGWSVVPDEDKTVMIGRNSIDGVQVDAKEVIRKLASQLDPSRLPKPNAESLGDFRSLPEPSTTPSDAIDQTRLYLKLNSAGYLKPDDIVLLGNATPIIGGRDFVLPPRAQVIASGIWFSIGHMLPAAQGAAVAQTTGRTILFDGDGSFQVTAQELSTIIRLRLDMTIFIINNGGYAYERNIHGMDEEYNDIAPWNYLDAPRLFGAPTDYPVRTYRLETWGDLDEMLAAESSGAGKGLTFVDVIVGKYDVPEKFKQVFQRAGAQL